VRAFANAEPDGGGVHASSEAVLRAVRCVAWRLAVPSFRTLYVSANAADVLGHPPERWRDTAAWLETVHADDRERVKREADVGIAAGQPFERDYRIVRADGRVVWVHDNIGFARDADGTVVELQGVTLDVTARRQHEERLRDDARRLELALRLAGVSSWEWHADVDRVRWDPLGRPLDDTTAYAAPSRAGFLERVHPDDRAAVDAAGWRVLSNGGEERVQFRLLDPAGSLRYVDSTIAAGYGADGVSRTLVGASRDVTAEATALREARLGSLLLDSLGEGVTLARYDGTILYTNAALDRMFGYAPRELVGRSLRELSSRTGPDYERRRTVLAAAVERDGFWSGPMLSRRRDGTPLQTYGTITCVPVDGESLWVTVRRDVTERHRLQREVLDASQREKELLAHELHEGLGQQLTGIALLAGTIRDEAQRRGLDSAANAGKLARLLLDAVGTCRRLAQGVSGFVVRNGGLETGLRELALSHEQRSGAPCLVECEERVSRALPPERARHLYWIAEEALAISACGGGTRDAALRLDAGDGRARLRVTLTGVAAERLEADGGELLRIIGYRAALLGAALATLPEPAGGVTLECVCPLDDGIGVST
jgi:PAS domain S-box-containing protein